jgi:CheY-like chemotaxis protein
VTSAERPAATGLVKRVLAVDDQPVLTRLLGQLLERFGWAVTPAASGEEALDLLRRQGGFNTVLADLGLGAGMDGWQLADAIAAEWPGVRVLIVSGWATGIDLDEASQHGVTAVLRKPYALDEMVAALESGGSAPPAA